MRGALSYRAGQAIAQLGMKLSRAVAQLRMSLRNPEIGVCIMIPEWAFPPRNTGKLTVTQSEMNLTVAQLGMNLEGDSSLIGYEPS